MTVTPAAGGSPGVPIIVKEVGQKFYFTDKATGKRYKCTYKPPVGEAMPQGGLTDAEQAELKEKVIALWKQCCAQGPIRKLVVGSAGEIHTYKTLDSTESPTNVQEAGVLTAAQAVQKAFLQRVRIPHYKEEGSLLCNDLVAQSASLSLGGRAALAGRLAHWYNQLSKADPNAQELATWQGQLDQIRTALHAKATAATTAAPPPPLPPAAAAATAAPPPPLPPAPAAAAAATAAPPAAAAAASAGSPPPSLALLPRALVAAPPAATTSPAVAADPIANAAKAVAAAGDKTAARLQALLPVFNLWSTPSAGTAATPPTSEEQARAFALFATYWEAFGS